MQKDSFNYVLIEYKPAKTAVSPRSSPQGFPRREVCVLATEVGSLSNDDGDGNENGKKTRGLDWQNNNNFARASLYFVQLFAVAARLQRESD